MQTVAAPGTSANSACRKCASQGWDLPASACVVHARRGPATPNPRPTGHRPSRPDGRFAVPAWTAEAIPEGLAPVTTRSGVLALAETATVGWRSDKRVQWRALWEVMTRWARWDTGLITVTRATVAAAVTALTGRAMSACTVSRYWRQARQLGWLVEVERGASAAALRSRRARSSTFAVVAPPPVPAVTESAHPTRGVKGESSVCSNSRSVTRSRATNAEIRKTDSQTVNTTPETPAGRRRATEALLRRTGLALPVARTTRALTPWYKTGWCPRAVLIALDHKPDGSRHPGPVSARARNVLGVVLWRLRLWDGHVPPLAGLSPSQAAARQEVDTPDVPTARAPGGMSRAARAAVEFVRSLGLRSRPVARRGPVGGVRATPRASNVTVTKPH